MPFIPALAVVFVGITNGDKIEHQIQDLVAVSHVERAKLPAATVRTIARHGEGAHDLVERMHVSGVIGGELIVEHGQVSLHLAIYNGEGSMKSYSEISLSSRLMTKDELDTLRDNITDEIANLTPPASKVSAPIAKLEPKRSAKTKIADPFANEIEMDAAPMPVPKRREAPAAPKPEIVVETTHVAAPVETADLSTDAVSAAELEALTGGTEVDQGGGNIGPTLSLDQLHLAAELGFGIASRSFSPGPSTVAAYSSSPVGAVHLAAHVQPSTRTRLDVSFEHTASMTTPIGTEMAPTSMSRWEVAGSYALVHGDSLDVRAHLGLGHRSFSIESIDPSRSPDGDYGYVIAGTSAALPLGDKVTLEGNLALEPVLFGTDSTEMQFGGATRWAVDAGVAAEVRPLRHVYIRAVLDYQRFSWSWDAAGTRGAGGAVDGYPSGMLSLGAQM